MMTKNIFSLPLNPKLNQSQFDSLINFIIEHKDYIRDVYFTSRIAPFNQDAMGDVFDNDPEDLIYNALALSNITGIKISATFNNIHVRPDQHNLDLFIKNFQALYDKGVRSATIPHTTWVLTGQIQKAFPELEIKNTILRSVNTASDVAKQAEAGFHYINIDRDLMRNRDELIKIGKVKAKYGIKVALLANEGCLGSCPIMDEHYHFNATRDKGPQYFNDIISRVSCATWDIKDPSSSLKTANIPPWKEDWDELLEFVDVFKMHGRESIDQLDASMKIISNYASGKEVLFDEFKQYTEVTELEGRPINAWRKFIKNCKFDCWDCNKCDKLYASKNAAPVYNKIDLVLDTLCTTYQD